jgi:hypothetical protein
MEEPYRSYVIRVHRARSGKPGVRLDIEDLQNGGRTAMHGPVARRIARLLVQLVRRPDGPGGA